MFLRRFITRRIAFTSVASALSVNVATLYITNHSTVCEPNTIQIPTALSESIQPSATLVLEIIGNNENATILNIFTVWSNWISDLSSACYDSYHNSLIFLNNVLIILCRSCYLSFLFTPNIVFSPLFYLFSSTSTSSHFSSSSSSSSFNTIQYISSHYQLLWWKLLKESIRKSGPCLTKFAQWIATRPDLFPLELCRQFQDLQSNQQFTPYTEKEVMNILKKEYEVHINDDNSITTNIEVKNRHHHSTTSTLLIDTIKNSRGKQEVITLGAGCVAQVIRGTLRITKPKSTSNSKSSSDDYTSTNDDITSKNRLNNSVTNGNITNTNNITYTTTATANITNTANHHDDDVDSDHSNHHNDNIITSSIPVAIKIVHPDIKSMIESDIIIMNYSTTLLESWFPHFRAFSMSDSVSEFSSLLLSQLDLIQEAHNLDQFRKNFHMNNDHSNKIKSVGNIRFPQHLVYEEITEFMHSLNANINYTLQQMKWKMKTFLKSIPFTNNHTTTTNYNDDDDDDDDIYMSESINNLSSYANHSILFPRPYHAYCTHNVLVEEYVEGILMSEMIDRIHDADRCQCLSNTINANTTNATISTTLDSSNNNNYNTINNNSIFVIRDTANHGQFPSAPSSSSSSSSSLAMLETRKQLARLGLDAILKMVFEDNFIHADLHPGNIICQDITPTKPSAAGATGGRGESERKKYRLVMIDAGLTASLSRRDRLNFIDVFDAIIRNDGARVGQLMMDRSRTTGSSREDRTATTSKHKNQLSKIEKKDKNDKNDKNTCLRPEEFKKVLQDLVSEVHQEGLSLKNISVGSLLQTLLVACYIHQVKLEAKFVSLILAIGVLEGLGQRLDPDVDILKQAAPYVVKAAVREALTRGSNDDEDDGSLR